ncbi:MAG: hypothetical protein KJN72_00920 [Woeseia sp.]|nr:hypothetical protein [Woeseia sp.]
MLHVEIRTFWGEDRTIPDLFIALNLRDITDSLGFDCGMLSLARRYGQRLVIRVRRLPLKLDYPNKDKHVVHGPDPLIVGVPSQVIEKDRHPWE